MTDRNDLSTHPQGHGQAPERFLARVQPEGAWRWGVVGWMLLALGAALGGATTCGMCLLGAMMPTTPSVTVPLAALLLLLVACCAAICWLGIVMIRAGRHLSRLEWITVDQHGIGQYDGVWTVTPWAQIRHLVWPLPHDSLSSSVRWALVDTGTGGGARMTDRTPIMAALDLARRRPRYACHLPVDALNVEAGELLRAIRHFSQGRFPDL